MHSVYRFNMTFGQISAASRFPFTYAQLRMRGFDHESAVRTCGVYLSEEELLHRIQRTNLGTKRHPLALIIEQCDELAYTLGDIEDAYDLHVIDAKDVFELIEQLLEHLQNNACYTTCDECTSACTCAQGAERAAEAVKNPQHQGMHPERYADSATNTGSFTGLTSFTSFSAQGQPNRLSAAAQGVRELRSQRDSLHLQIAHLFLTLPALSHHAQRCFAFLSDPIARRNLHILEHKFCRARRTHSQLVFDLLTQRKPAHALLHHEHREFPVRFRVDQKRVSQFYVESPREAYLR